MSCNQRFRLLRQVFRHRHGLVSEAVAGSSALCGASSLSPPGGFGRTTSVRGLIGPAGGGGLPRDKFPPNYQFDDGGFASPDGPSATEMVWPMSRRQHKFSSRLLNALESVIESDFHMVELCRSTGFTILEVRAAPDLRKAYVKWDAFPRRMKAAEAGLSRRMNRLRAMTSRKLGSKFMPWLEFRHDGPTEEQRETERALRQVESEMAAEGGISYKDWYAGDGDQPRDDDDERWDDVIEEPNEPGRVFQEHSSSSSSSSSGGGGHAFAHQGARSHHQELAQEGEGATERQRTAVDAGLAGELDGISRPDESTGIGSGEAMVPSWNDDDADDDADGGSEEKEDEGDSGDAGARIWELIEEMAAKGASEEEMKARVQREVRKALSGEE